MPAEIHVTEADRELADLALLVGAVVRLSRARDHGDPVPCSAIANMADDLLSKLTSHAAKEVRRHVEQRFPREGVPNV